MTDTFRITAYNAATDIATVTFVIGAQRGFSGASATVSLKGIPKDTSANVKAFMRNYVDAYITGKLQEEAASAVPSQEVAALLNTTTEF